MLYFWLKIIFIGLALLLVMQVFLLYRKAKQRNQLVKKDPILSDSFANQITSEPEDTLNESKFGNYARRQGERGVNPITLTILAQKGRHYAGYELLQALLAVGFRYGEMNIFHRHENTNGTGQILFSVAQAVAPGTFDLSDVGAINCPGLILFMEVNKASHVLLHTLDLMLETGKQIVEELGGDLYDEQRQPLSHLSIERWQNTISRLEVEDFGELS